MPHMGSDGTPPGGVGARYQDVEGGSIQGGPMQSHAKVRPCVFVFWVVFSCIVCDFVESGRSCCCVMVQCSVKPCGVLDAQDGQLVQYMFCIVLFVAPSLCTRDETCQILLLGLST